MAVKLPVQWRRRRNVCAFFGIYFCEKIFGFFSVAWRAKEILNHFVIHLESVSESFCFFTVQVEQLCAASGGIFYYDWEGKNVKDIKTGTKYAAKHKKVYWHIWRQQ